MSVQINKKKQFSLKECFDTLTLPELTMFISSPFILISFYIILDEYYHKFFNFTTMKAVKYERSRYY